MISQFSNFNFSISKDLEEKVEENIMYLIYTFFLEELPFASKITPC